MDNRHHLHAKKTQAYHPPLFFPLLSPYNRNRLKAEIAERSTNERLASNALATPSPIWLQNFPNKVHVFIHWSSICPNCAKTAVCAAAATADKVKYAITWYKQATKYNSWVFSKVMFHAIPSSDVYNAAEVVWYYRWSISWLNLTTIVACCA